MKFRWDLTESYPSATWDELIDAMRQGIGPAQTAAVQGEATRRLCEAVGAASRASDAQAVAMHRLTRWIFWLTMAMTALGIVQVYSATRI